MVTVAHKQSTSPAPAGRVILGADIGGTHARFGLVHFEAARAPYITDYQKFRCRDYGGLPAAIEAYLETLNGRAFDGAAVAIAGYQVGDDLLNANLPWAVKISETRAALGVDRVGILNDYVAVGFATSGLDAADMTPLNPAAGLRADGPIAVLGPGTGLGAAVLIPAGGAVHTVTTEAGQVSFAASTDVELEILKLLRRDGDYVSLERVLSGPGLLTLYRTLGDINAVDVTHERPSLITAAALAGDDALAAEAVNVFCGVLGSATADLAMNCGARGGVYLAGGILPRIRDLLTASPFLDRFFDKGAMRPYLEAVPVNLINHGQLGVLGAASWHLDAGNGV